MITFAYDVLGLLLALLPFVALAVVITVIVCAGRKVWPRLPRWMRPCRVPSRNPDGRPLTVPERETPGLDGARLRQDRPRAWEAAVMFTPDEDRLLLVNEVATMLRVHPDTVRRWDAEGRLRAIRTPGNQRRWWESEVRELLEVRQ